jgi:oligopeptide/dipeptide ABC transporter ATP-binding protein
LKLTDLAQRSESSAGSGGPVLEVRGLKTQFFTDEGIVQAVDGVSFSVAGGETLGIVGESGSGKTVAALSLMRLLEDPCRIVAGEILFQGRDVLAMSPAELRAFRGGGVAMVFQNPMTSLNPVLRIARQLVETMVVHGRYDLDDATGRSIDLLGRMGITAPQRAIRSYPHQFSGGMRQRVVIAMGMSNEPSLLIADEPTTALDVTIQAQILELMQELTRRLGVALIIITHNLGVVARYAQRVNVMYAGRIVESGTAAAIYHDPHHPYTIALLRSVPRLDRPRQARLDPIEGQPPDLTRLGQGCSFQPRCRFAIERCGEAPPPLLPAGAPGQQAACYRSHELDAAGRAA